MKQFHTVLTALSVLLMAFYLPGFSQGGNHGGNHGGHFDPDSLVPITVSGTAIVDSSTMMMSMYYLDEDGDGQADYHLNFGPPWYQPDSGNATRPNDGDVITIYGGKHDSTMFGFPTIIVYEINGEFWRDPYNPFWHNHGGHSHGGGHHQGGCNGFAFGWMHDSLQSVSINGTALVDTTFMMDHYYLDEDANGLPDYFLNFGPPWYEPTSGATRPNDGDQIDIVGGMLSDTALTIPMVIVYEINGLFWRDSTQIGPHFGGGWFHRNMTQSQQFHAPFDPHDWMQINPGWHQMGGGHHGGMMPDSMFGQMLQLYPQNIPNAGNQNNFAGYEIGMFAGNGQNMMWQGGSCGGHLNFGSAANFQLHYNDIQLQGFNIDENSIQAKYWDDQSNSWITISNAVVDPVNNTITFSETEVSNFLILTGDQVTGVETGEVALQIEGFTLQQNYPNPFNPETKINFDLKNNAQVVLNVYNVLGQKVVTLLNKEMNAGSHSVNFDAQSLPTGTYFYELKVDEKSKVMKMSLMK